MSSSDPRSTAACRSASIARSSSASSSLASDSRLLALATKAWADSTAWRRLGVMTSSEDRAGWLEILAGPENADVRLVRVFERAEDGFESIDGVAALALAEPFGRTVDHDMLGQARWPVRWPSL